MSCLYRQQLNLNNGAWHHSSYSPKSLWLPNHFIFTLSYFYTKTKQISSLRSLLRIVFTTGTTATYCSQSNFQTQPDRKIGLLRGLNHRDVIADKPSYYWTMSGCLTDVISLYKSVLKNPTIPNILCKSKWHQSAYQSVK